MRVTQRLFMLVLALVATVVLAGTFAAELVFAGGVVGNGTSASCTEAAFTAALSGGGTVTFNCGGPKTILITSVKSIAQDTTIDGGGQIILTGGLATRLFNVSSGVTLTLRNIVLDSAFATGSDGGAISSNGTLVLDNVTIQFSQTDSAHSGGAIFSAGPVFINNSLFKNNTGGSAGAIFINFANARARITNSRFNNNQAVNTITGYGGALWVGTQAVANIVDSSFNSNSAKYGGALYVTQGGTAALRTEENASRVSFANNSVSDDGGAIYSEGALNIVKANFLSNRTISTTAGVGFGGAIASLGSLTLYDGYFNGNQGRFGGAAFVGGSVGSATALIDRSYFALNTAAQLGGGLYTNVEATTITVTNSVFNANKASSGGGVARFNAKLYLENSSLSSNQATSTASGAGGGGLYVGAGPSPTAGGYVRVRSVTIAYNSAGSIDGGGVLNGGLLELYFTTIVSNTQGVFSVLNGNTRFRSSVLQNPSYLNCDGDGTASVSDDASNYSTDVSCPLPVSQTGFSLDPKLGPITVDALSPTFYLMPLPGSPLINASSVACPVADQRGALRVGTCDIGAVEFGGLVRHILLPIILR